MFPFKWKKIYAALSRVYTHCQMLKSKSTCSFSSPELGRRLVLVPSLQDVFGTCCKSGEFTWNVPRSVHPIFIHFPLRLNVVFLFLFFFFLFFLLTHLSAGIFFPSAWLLFLGTTACKIFFKTSFPCRNFFFFWGGGGGIVTSAQVFF